MAELPQPADIARVLPAAIAEAGGSLSITNLENSFSSNARVKIQGVQTSQQADYLKSAFLQAIEILVRARSAERSDDRVTLTDKGWAQAEALGVHPPREQPTGRAPAREEEKVATIDLSDAAPWVKQELRDGTVVMGYLRPDAQKYHGRPFVPPASALLDALYRAEINGVHVAEGFYSALKDVGAFRSATEILRGMNGSWG